MGLYAGDVNFCYLYFNLIVGAEVHANSIEQRGCSVRDGVGRLRREQSLIPVANFAVHCWSRDPSHRQWSLWSDCLVRATCVDAIALAASLALTAFRQTGSDGIMMIMIMEQLNGDNDKCGKFQLIPGPTACRS